MKKIFFSVFFLIALSGKINAQFTNVIIDSTRAPEEVSICINPKNPSEIAAGANIKNYYYSQDSGKTWQQNYLSSTSGVWGDPCVLADSSGDFYFVHLSYPFMGNWIDRIVCQKSIDGGKHYTQDTYTGLNGKKNQDKAWGAIDLTNSNYKNNIYLTWTQFDKYASTNRKDSSIILFSRSSDAGKTWTYAQRISSQAGNCLDGDSTVEGAVPCVGPSGQIYVSWAGPSGLVFNKSYDTGKTWLPHEKQIAEIPGGWDYEITGINRANGLPITACDISNSIYRGTIYVNWTDQRNGNTDTDVWLIKSSDGGESWTSPIRVNNDAPGKQQFFTWMTIDQSNGNVYCIFYDRREHSGDTTDVYMARSTDGGNTFSNFKINKNYFVPDAETFFGDYVGLSVDNRMIRPIWMQLDKRHLEIATALINDNMLGLPSIQNMLTAPEIPQENRVNDVFDFAFNLSEDDFVNLSVKNILGENILQLYKNNFFEKGEHDFIFNPKKYFLKRGIYYFSFESKNEKIKKKICVL
ncbi:MAG: glycosyl hydrolase [Bacteroidia bacterium]